MSAGPGGSAEGDRPALERGSSTARWVIAATVLGSGIAFLDSTVVNVALPAISEEFDASIASMQWTVNAYLVTLSALMLLGGSLGDRFGRRAVFVAGLSGFLGASVLCGAAPTVELLIAARALQGVAGALLVPSSLAIISATFHPDHRGWAIGVWSGLSGVSSAVGPFVGGWLIDAVSWRLVFLINVPAALATIVIARRHVPETRAEGPAGPLDLGGALLVSIALGAVSYAAIEHRGAASVAVAALGVVCAAAFVLVERRADAPMVPLEVFRSRQFSGANVTTFLVYGGLGGAMFFVVLHLQVALGYTALEAGASLVPFTVLMLFLSPSAGQLGRTLGPRLPMTLGPLVAGAGLAMLAGVQPGDRYLTGVLPGVAVFGLGMSIMVAPLTAAVLGDVEEARVGVASGINNAVARLAGLLAVAAIPALAGFSTAAPLEQVWGDQYVAAMWICAGLCVAGGVVAAATMRRGADVRALVHPTTVSACDDPAAMQAPPDDRPERGRPRR